MKNQGIFRKLGDFVLGKGFYIVLFLCVATIGISGYYLIRTMTGQPEDSQQAGGDASVVLPDSEANGPDPAGTLLPDDLEQPDPSVQDTTAPQDVEQPDDPEPVKQPQETVQTEPPDAESAVYVWPVEGEILRDFSVESLSPDPTLGDWRTHAGLDIAAALDSQVLAMSAGTVSEVYEDGLMGTTVVLDHGNGLITTYCNLAGSPAVQAGQTVEAGEIIGAVGGSAIVESSLEPHLHLEASLNGQVVDPREYLPQ